VGGSITKAYVRSKNVHAVDADTTKCRVITKLSVKSLKCYYYYYYRFMALCRDYPGEPVPEETFTQPHPSQSPIILHLPPSIAIHGILPIQSDSLFAHLCPSFLSWSSTLHFILHTLPHPIIVFFLQHMPIPSQPVLL